MSSRLKYLSRKVFERHSNPWSAWNRLLSAPLVFVPFWTRNWKHAAIIGTWMLANPVAFPKPKDDRAWATRAMLGEEMWVSERPKDAAMAANVFASVFGLGGVISAHKRSLLPTSAFAVAQIATLLIYWQMMSDYYEEHSCDS